MWFEYLVCVAIFIAILYIPGFLFFRSFSVSRIVSTCCAPLFSVALFGLLPIVYGKANIACNWIVLVVPALLVSLALFLLFNRKREQRYAVVTLKRPWTIFAAYIVVGVAACCFIFVSALGDFDTIHFRHDNVMHFNSVRAFIDSGNWSSLGMGPYLDASPNAIPFDEGYGFYPGAWHDTVAIAVSMTGFAETVVVNAFNSVITGIVFPLCMLALMFALFRNDALAVVAGAVVTPAFNSFPWYFFIKGPLVGNMLAYSLLPAVCALLVFLVMDEKKNRAFWVRVSFLGLVSCIALGLSQPNALFSFYVFAAAFLGHRLRAWMTGLKERRAISRVWFWAALLLFAAAVVVLWVAMYKLPAFSSVVKYRYKTDNGLDPANALYDTLSMGFVLSTPSWLFVGLALLGILAAVVKGRAWLCAPPAFFSLAYFVARAFYGRRPRQLLAGFWYSDPTRLAGSLTIFITPLVSCGLALALRWLLKTVSNLAGSKEPFSLWSRSTAPALGLLMAAFCCLAFFPNYAPFIWNPEQIKETPIGAVKQRIADVYNKESEKVYSTEEREFVEKVKSLIPEEALVLNFPQDGSLLAYGLDGLNVYYRSASSSGYSKDADVIRKGIDKVASDQEVQDAIKKTGAKYLMLLDQGVSYQDGSWLGTYHERYVPLWDGFNRITDDTPGLKLLLSDGDMRLYEITAVE